MEITIKKSFLNIILKSVILSFISLIVIMHFGKTGTYYHLDIGMGDCEYLSPFESSHFTGANFNTSCNLSYFDKLIKFYIPSAFYYPLQLIIAIIIWTVLLFFGRKTKFKIEK